MGGGKIWEWGMRHPKQHTELHLWADTPTPPESAAETQGAAGDLQQVLKGQDRVGKKGFFQYFGYKSNYPIIVLCELASPPQMGLLCNSCWVQKALNILLCPVMSHQSISRAQGCDPAFVSLTIWLTVVDISAKWLAFKHPSPFPPPSPPPSAHPYSIHVSWWTLWFLDGSEGERNTVWFICVHENQWVIEWGLGDRHTRQLRKETHGGKSI